MVTAAQEQFRRETVDEFEINQSLLRDRVTTEAVIKGETAKFLVAGSGGATAVTRGVNGRIPSRNDSLAQPTATLQEWHDKVERAGFDLFASQGDGEAVMRQSTMAVINRKIDDLILTALATGTLTTNGGVATTASANLLLNARTILANNEVPCNDGNLCAVVSPAFYGFMLQSDQFSSIDFVDAKPNAARGPKIMYWNNMFILEHPNLTGVGTSSATCFVFHKSAIGHAANVAGMGVASGYNEEDDYSFARVSLYMGSVKLQNAGIIKVLHNDSALSA